MCIEIRTNVTYLFYTKVHKQPWNKMEIQETQKSKTKSNHESSNIYEEVNQNYDKRVDDVEHASSHLANVYADLNSEILHGCLNVVHIGLEAQKKFTKDWVPQISTDNVLNMVKQNTDQWAKMVENTDSVYTNYLNNCKAIMKMMNDSSVQSINFLVRNYDFLQNNLQKR